MTERRRTGVLLCKNTRLNKASISCAQKYDLRSSYDQDSTKRAQKLSEIGHLMTDSFNFQGITSSNRGLRFQFATFVFVETMRFFYKYRLHMISHH